MHMLAKACALQHCLAPQHYTGRITYPIVTRHSEVKVHSSCTVQFVLLTELDSLLLLLS